MLKELRKILREVAQEVGFVTTPWSRINPLWKLSLLFGGTFVGWGLHAMLGSHSSEGIVPLVTGSVLVIGGTALIEYLFCEEEDEHVAQNAKRPSSSDSSDD